MKITNLKSSDNWLDIKNSALNTVDKKSTIEPNSKWKRELLLSEHSPIRKLKLSFKLEGLKSYISVHLVRHKFGIEHFVSTRRTDRTGINRDELRQDELVNHEIELNAQAMINISRKRLCYQASEETKKAWEEVVENVREIEPELASVCVRECTYRGWCTEMFGCNYDKSEKFKEELNEYRNWRTTQNAED